MASLTIHNIDDPLKARLRMRAERHGRSVGEEVRQILLAALEALPAAPDNLADRMRARFEPLGGVDLDVGWLRDEQMRDPPTFD